MGSDNPRTEQIVDRFTLLATHALSSAMLGFVLTQNGGTDVLTGALVGAVVFLCLRHMHDTMSLSRDKRELEEDMKFLRAATLSVRASLDDTAKNARQITTALAKRTDTLEKKVTTELKFIERFLAELPVAPAAKPKALTAAPQSRALADPAMLDLIRRALDENRVDLYLQPVVSLPQRKVRFYEALTRLRSADGAIVMPSHYISVAAPAGLMSVIDNLLLLRCVQLVRRLSHKTRDVAIFCNISEHTLADTEFFPQLLEFLRANRDISNQIVFEFAQDTVLQGGRAVESGLKALHDLGFRLSLDQVTLLNCNFTRLRQQGFHFIKVKARTLISGMGQALAPVSAEDFKDLLARHGIELIVERVEDEKTVVQLLEFNVAVGQGFLFGEPKPLRDVGEIHDARTKELTAASAGRSAPGLARRLAG
jgi:cyclic-di-GMP phosphodiesterase, flagellum assembly factor TipF